MVPVFTDEPKTRIWQLLNQFSYPKSIRRVLSENGQPAPAEVLVEFISGCLRQAEAYFHAAENAPLHISPLLFYYGATNLVAGGACLITGTRFEVHSHGMKLELPTAGLALADTKLTPIDPNAGALEWFTKTYSSGLSLMGTGTWSLGEVFASISDLSEEFVTCYADQPLLTMKVERIEEQKFVLDRFKLASLVGYAKPGEALEKIERLTDAYLDPQTQNKYVILYRKLMAPDIVTRSVFGEPYLSIGHLKGSRLYTPDQIILMTMGLYILGTLSRYHPEIWNPFADKDESGEKPLVRRFLYLCSRVIPNLVLNRIVKQQILAVQPSGHMPPASVKRNEER